MSKSKGQKRKRAARVDLPNKSAKLTKNNGIITPPPDGDNANAAGPTTLQTVVSDEELEITVETLAALARNPGLIKSKACKDLRAAVYDFRQASATGLASAADSSNLTAQITGALADGKYTEARVKLAEMRIRGQRPKLGALCRWVRDLDVISGLSTVPEANGAPVLERTAHQRELITVIDAVLRAAGHGDNNLTARIFPGDCPIALQETWDLRPSNRPAEEVYASVLDKSIFASAPADLSSSLRIIETTPGPQRKPPNHHDAILYTSAPNTIPLSSDKPPVQWHDHPAVPGLGLATGVLSPAECKAVIAAGETVTFVPDAPLREDGDVSILAHNFYWVVDEPFHDALWERVRGFVPSAVDGRLARGLNRRFRVYRYVPGAEYRAHIDGAWPPSGIAEGDRYVYDASPAGKRQSSLFTFLIYLNDEFEGGETTFFLPAAREGTLNAYPVRPVMGAVAVFPHGDPALAVLHEGTGVRRGAKYVIRTEVEYDVEPSEV